MKMNSQSQSQSQASRRGTDTTPSWSRNAAALLGALACVAAVAADVGDRSAAAVWKRSSDDIPTSPAPAVNVVVLSVAIGGSILGVVLGCCVFVCCRRRERRMQQAAERIKEAAQGQGQGQGQGSNQSMPRPSPYTAPARNADAPPAEIESGTLPPAYDTLSTAVPMPTVGERKV
ncbi:hypothetical protein M427DRAFT_150580 [Gonapodya prolifera JEL478]|uniref:Transmembrane protein n=1 Tax=Gonapodya prolifera (strain JEL478) TaxID=1344416 RepID=A0A139AZV6_GONPJ|nr:hypothetical protein M427DRAFT_150580 [Gonapodya prolifera JEL478]|eukprot:KXS22244.1 hypothetical protein M427DRAFT_150580 [Gonapodya prolifera JEL478]